MCKFKTVSPEILAKNLNIKKKKMNMYKTKKKPLGEGPNLKNS